MSRGSRGISHGISHGISRGIYGGPTLDGLGTRRSYRSMRDDKTSQSTGRPNVRREREAEALRANLRKRKDQQRAREAAAHDEPRASPDDPSHNPPLRE